MEPAYYLGVGEPEPGGLMPREAIVMMRDAVTQLDLGTFGFGMVEYSHRTTWGSSYVQIDHRERNHFDVALLLR